MDYFVFSASHCCISCAAYNMPGICQVSIVFFELRCVAIYCRVGLMGNPSDGFYGKTISLSIENFWAEVTITESSKLLQLQNHQNWLVN